MKTFIAAVTVAAGLLALAPAAHASTAQAALDDIRFDLLDLQPDDGIAPSFTSESLAPFNFINSDDQGVEAVDGVARTLTYHDDQVDLFASAALDGRSLLAFASGNGKNVAINAMSVTPLLLGEPCCLAVLSAHTQLIVRGTVRLSVSDVNAMALASAQAVVPDGGKTVINTVSVGHGESFNPNAPFDPVLFKQSELTLTLRNDTDQDLSFFLTLGTSALVPTVAAVPEPGAILLAAAGLASVLVARRRRV